MRVSRFILSVTLLIALGAILAGANTLNGSIFQGVSDPNNANDPGNWNTAGPYATFATISINYDTRLTGYTPSLFLNNPVFTSFNSFDPNADLDNIAIVLTGRQWLKSGANTFYVTHDDGVYISIADLAFTLDASGPTAPDTTYFTVNNSGAAGLYGFTLNYTECCGAPAVLVSNLGSTPEPGTLLMFGSGVLGLAGLVRRKLNI
jgi:hypothetical protein